MPRIPDAVAVASLDTHRLIVTVRNDGHADIASNLAPRDAAHVMRQIADGYEQRAGRGWRALTADRPCPVHNSLTTMPDVDEHQAPAVDSFPVVEGRAYRHRANADIRVEVTRVWTSGDADEPSAAYDIHGQRDWGGRPYVSHSACRLSVFRKLYRPVGSEQAEAALDELTDVFRGLALDSRTARRRAEALLARHALALAEDVAALGKARGWSTWAADYIHPDRRFLDTGTPDGTESAQ